MAALFHHRKLMFSDEASNTPPIEQLCSICDDANSVNHPANSPDSFSSSFVIAFLPAIMTTVLLCGCFSIYRWSSRQSQPPPQELYGGGVDHRRLYVRTTGGLHSSVINAIAIYRYKKGEGEVEGLDCAVCLTEFQEDEILRMLPNCKHAFHVPCIDTWLKSHTNCPVCRAGVESTENSDVALPVLVLNREHGGIPVNNGGEREDSEAHECRSAVHEKEDESTEQNVVPKNNNVEHS